MCGHNLFFLKGFKGQQEACHLCRGPDPRLRCFCLIPINMSCENRHLRSKSTHLNVFSSLFLALTSITDVVFSKLFYNFQLLYVFEPSSERQRDKPICFFFFFVGACRPLKHNPPSVRLPLRRAIPLLFPAPCDIREVCKKCLVLSRYKSSGSVSSRPYR